MFSAILNNEFPKELASKESLFEDRLLNAAEYHGVASLIRYQLMKNGFLKQCSSEFLASMQATELRQAAIQGLRDKENKQVLSQITQNRLEFILLKGEALAWQYYQKSHHRSRGDVDILFADKESAEKAWGILNQLGYGRSPSLSGELVGFQFECKKELNNVCTNFLDIHNRLFNNVWLSDRFPFEELKANCRLINYQGIQARVLDGPYALIHAALHWLINIPKGIEDRLIWHYDIKLLLNSFNEESYENFLTIARKKSISNVCYDALRKTDTIFPGSLQGPWEIKLREQASLEPKPADRLKRHGGTHFENMASRKMLNQKISYALTNLFPPPNYMRKRYGIEYNRHLPYYYLRRIYYFLRGKPFEIRRNSNNKKP